MGDLPAVREHQRRLGRRGIGHPDARVADLVEGDDLDLARAVHAQEDRHRAVAEPAHHREPGVAGPRVDHHVGDQQVAGIDAEQRGDLPIDRGHVPRPRRPAGHLLAEMQGGDGHLLGVGREEHAFGPERQLADVLELGGDAGRRLRVGRGPSPSDRQAHADDEQQAETECRHAVFSFQRIIPVLSGPGQEPVVKDPAAFDRRCILPDCVAPRASCETPEACGLA